MTSEDLLFSIDGSVAVITLNRPKVMNALNLAITNELQRILPEIENTNHIRSVIVTGNGPAFCAGADLKEVLASGSLPAGERDFLDRICDCMAQLRDLSKPVIAALNGITMAGGLELAMCADIVLAAESATIGDGHANFGVYPGAGGAAVLPRLVPLNVAKYLLFTGDTLSVEEMKGYGFVNQVVEDESLMDSAFKLANRLCQKSPIALSRMKRVANHTSDMSRDDALAREQVELRKHYRSWDMNEGLAAFTEKRKPEFRGY